MQNKHTHTLYIGLYIVQSFICDTEKGCRCCWHCGVYYLIFHKWHEGLTCILPLRAYCLWFITGVKLETIWYKYMLLKAYRYDVAFGWCVAFDMIPHMYVLFFKYIHLFFLIKFLQNTFVRWRASFCCNAKTIYLCVYEKGQLRICICNLCTNKATRHIWFCRAQMSTLNIRICYLWGFARVLLNPGVSFCAHPLRCF